MRNIFRRQTETAAPTLRERAASLREGLSRQDPAPGERADLYDRLLTLYAEDREARPVQGREDGTVASRAAILVSNRLWALARETIAMPPPKTMEGLRATALASAVLCEAEHSQEDPTALAAIGLTRAALSVTGTPLPPGFVGFGDETDHEDAAQTALDVADKIIAALDRLDGSDTPKGIKTAPDPRPADVPAPLAQIVRLGDLGDFRTAIPRPRAAREERPAIPLPEPETTPMPESEADDAEGFATNIARPREEAAQPEIRVPFPPLPWGGAGNVVAAAGCAVLALVGMRA